MDTAISISNNTPGLGSDEKQYRRGQWRLILEGCESQVVVGGLGILGQVGKGTIVCCNCL